MLKTGFFLTLLLAFACAGVARYPTGVRASGADKYFFYLTQAASERGLKAYSHPASGRTEASVQISTNDGEDLYYDVDPQSDSIDVTVRARTERDGVQLPENEVAARQEALRKLSQELTDVAKKRAVEGNAFEPAPFGS